LGIRTEVGRLPRLVSTVDGFHVRIRRGWDMTALVPELAALPGGSIYDGELLAFGRDGLPSFPNVCRRLLQRERRVPLVFLVFDVLAIDGEPVAGGPTEIAARFSTRSTWPGP
jgi:ATP-dependent DNA ligase